MADTFCDLHTHSLYSDGTYTPREIIDEAEKLGLAAVALCDHNTTAGIKEFKEAAKGKRVEAIPAIEFSTDYKDTELHIIALFIKDEHFEKIEKLTEDMKARKDRSNDALIDSLHAAGYVIDYEKIKSAAGDQINRAHIAEALVSAGYFSSIKEAFSEVLSPKKGFYKKPARLPVFETIEFIGSIGAVSILAHPYLSMDRETVEAFLEEATKHGLVGMETVYSTYDEETTLIAKNTAKKYGLSESGGSDFHGYRKPDISLGVGKGNLSVPHDFLLKLKSFIRK